jgi:hypothetical protein
LSRSLWHCLLNHLGIEPLPAFLNPSKEPIASRFVELIVPFPKILLDQSLVVERKCQLGVDSLLGTLLPERDGVLEDVFCVRLSCIAYGINELSMSHSACQSAIHQYHASIDIETAFLDRHTFRNALGEMLRHAVELALDAV